MYLSSRKASEAILCARLLILKIYFPTTHILCHTQAVKSISSSMCEFTGTSTRSNRPQDTLLVFWFSLVKADIFLFTVLVTLTLTNSSSLRSMYSEIFRPLLNPRLSKEASVLLWATIDPPVFRLKAEVNNRWSVWKMNYFGKGGRLRAVPPFQRSPSRKQNKINQNKTLVSCAELWEWGAFKASVTWSRTQNFPPGRGRYGYETRRHPYGPARQADINFFSFFFSSFNFKSAPQTFPKTWESSQFSKRVRRRNYDSLE